MTATSWGFYDEDVHVLIAAGALHGDAREAFLLERFGSMRVEEALQATEALTRAAEGVDLGDGTVLMRDFG